MSLPRLLLLASLLLSLSCERKPGTSKDAPAQAIGRQLCAVDAEARLPELPRSVQGFCLPAALDVRRFGMGRQSGLTGICGELFGEDCEFYKTLGLRSMTLASLRSETEGARELRVALSDFEDARGAFAFVQERALGAEQSDPDVRSVPLRGARAFVARGVLWVWRGRRALELAYVGEDQTAAEAQRSAADVLPRVAENVLETLGAPAEVPREVRFFEDADFEFASTRPPELVASVLGISQTGPGGAADLRDRHGAYRALFVPCLDEPSAKDLMRTIQSGLGAPPLGKKTGILRARRLRPEAEPESWYFTRVGASVVGVGPLPEGSQGAIEEPSRARMEARLDGMAKRALRVR